MDSVIKLDKVIDVEHLLEDALDIIQIVKPKWNRENISYKVFDNGITNKMYGFYHNQDQSTMTLVRVNGSGTDLFLERPEEVKSFELLHSYECAPTLYCVFGNGLCYEYMQGSTLSKEEVRSPIVYKLLTAELAKVHSISCATNTSQQPMLFRKMRRFMELAFQTSVKGTDDPLESKLRVEVDELERHLDALHSPVVFCHNDLLLHNIIYNSKTDTVKFIDYEYAAFNYQAYDIGNHFCEFAGIDEVDFTLYPDKEFQMGWLRAYLTAWHSFKHAQEQEQNGVFETEVERLYKQVNKFALAAHLFWGIWSLVQARSSKIDFDYKQYSKLRIDEYYRRKEEFLSL